jgi:DNA-binding NtrC family response regulator
MAIKLSQPDNINVLINNADWAWPQAVAQIFQPRGINALVADSAQHIVQIIDNRQIHLAILDKFSDNLTGVQILKLIRQRNPLLPCIVLAGQINEHLLAQALALDAFSVLAKPVCLPMLQEQINRLFLKYYDSSVFDPDQGDRPESGAKPVKSLNKQVFKIVYRFFKK